MKQLTYSESGKYYAVITLPNGHTYYSGPKNSRATARRYALRENSRHAQATRQHMIYNVRLGQ